MEARACAVRAAACARQRRRSPHPNQARSCLFEHKSAQCPLAFAQMMENGVVSIEQVQSTVERPRKHRSLTESAFMFRKHRAVARRADGAKIGSHKLFLD